MLNRVFLVEFNQKLAAAKIGVKIEEELFPVYNLQCDVFVYMERDRPERMQLHVRREAPFSEQLASRIKRFAFTFIYLKS